MMENKKHMDNTGINTSEKNSVTKDAVILPDVALNHVNGGAGIVDYVLQALNMTDIDDATENGAGFRPFLK